MDNRRKVAALVALALGTVSYVVFAHTTAGGSTNKTFLSRVAEKLGVTADALVAAMYEAKGEMLDEAVAAGELTQAQAEYLKAVLKARLDYWKAEGQGRGVGWPGFGRGMMGICPFWQARGAFGR